MQPQAPIPEPLTEPLLRTNPAPTPHLPPPIPRTGCQGAADPQPRGSEWAGAKGWSRESHGKASASQKTDDDQPPPSTITRQPSLLPLLGPTLAALDQLPDEVLLQIMISVEVRSRKQ